MKDHFEESKVPQKLNVPEHEQLSLPPMPASVLLSRLPVSLSPWKEQILFIMLGVFVAKVLPSIWAAIFGSHDCFGSLNLAQDYRIHNISQVFATLAGIPGMKKPYSVDDKEFTQKCFTYFTSGIIPEPIFRHPIEDLDYF
ncbi:hypothetical protein IQ07DRAFT_659147 [Pyrenochaeta sp. DS3sAY3a]|nr:hypothetical protein IQ07DRAFT_659147 [Pyrenochaeta sp. DS3sAY3a]